MKNLNRASTGLESLDTVIDHLRIGDNVVWQVDDIAGYVAMVLPFVECSLQEGRKVIYMRFAQHEPLLEARTGLTIYRLDSSEGFESFATRVHEIITREGRGAYYVFDSLSDLLPAWGSDLMIGNFFMITCPYLFELDTIAYFALMRSQHCYATVARIRETTQVLFDAYSCGSDPDSSNNFYVQPMKVWKRYAPTMFLPHLHKDGTFIPVTNSLDASMLFQHLSRFTENPRRNLDYWDRLFMEAEDLITGNADDQARTSMLARLCDFMISREPRMSRLVRENFTLENLLDIKSRLIGSGFIGGKTVGMLLARKILQRDTAADWASILEQHDSFYIGADVFYSYLVNNNCWKLRMQQKTPEGYFSAAPVLAEEILNGTFPDDIREQFLQIIEYFGQSPIIVRSSSLLEDAFGNAFAGKYESAFCANQGSPEERYAAFEQAVKRIYAGTMNEDALIYRRQRGLENQDEQMALLVQRVSGSYRKHFFFPDIGGVGVSYNTFVWKKGMDPKAGMLRMVFGLGTRAVDRVEGDYPRLVALDDPMSRPFSKMDDLRTFSQHSVDVINTSENTLQTVPFLDLVNSDLSLPLDRIAVHDQESTQRLRDYGKAGRQAWILTFDELLTNSRFTSFMQAMLKRLEQQYDYPVDIEFTVNFTRDADFRINLVQCRPLQTFGEERTVKLPAESRGTDVLFRLEGNFMGGSISQTIDRIIFIEPDAYINLPLYQKYEVARVVGALNRQIVSRSELPTMLLGPGRWGTTTPTLGVPVHFADISNMTVLGEIASMEGNFMPELSFGTHFFQDLVENRIFFVAIFPWKEGVVYDTSWLAGLPSVLSEVAPDKAAFAPVVKVYDVRSCGVRIIADVVKQQLVCLRSERLP
jgi:hypothetical protein